MSHKTFLQRRSDKYIHLFLQARFGWHLLLHICPAFLHAHLFVSHLSSSICFSLNHKKHKTDLPKPFSPFVFPQITCTVLLHFEHEWAFEAGFWHTIHVTLSVFPVPETSSVVSIMSKSFLNPVFVISCDHFISASMSGCNVNFL